MPALVPAEVLKATTQCRFSFSCLQNGYCGTQPMCPGDHMLSARVLCICADEKRDCPYHLFFKHAQFCICPTRIALWHEHGNRWHGPPR